MRDMMIGQWIEAFEQIQMMSYGFQGNQTMIWVLSSTNIGIGNRKKSKKNI